MIKQLQFLLIASVFTISVSAQTAEEAIRYSELTFGGTARGMGVAGAMGAIGADLSSLHVNPAGIGQYRSSEVSISPQLNFFSNDAYYINSNETGNKANFNLANLGAVFTFKYEDSRGNRGRGNWISTHLGLNLTRVANFNKERYYSATTTNSTLNEFAAELNNAGLPPADVTFSNFAFETVLVHGVEVVNANSSNNYSAVTEGLPIDQTIEIDQWGGIDEFGMSFGANYNHKLYFGVYLGIPFLNYGERIRTREYDTRLDTVPHFNYFHLRQNLNTDGVGFNAKFGLIYRANRWVRIGAAIHTPTRYSMEDLYDSRAKSDFDTITITYDSPFGEFDYHLRTPWRFVGSAAFIIKKHGFISVDYEFVDYSSARYNYADIYSSAEQVVNEPIGKIYGSAHIIRVGGEGVIDKFRVRAGYAYYGSPYKDPDGFQNGEDRRQHATAGFGYREQRWYLDFAYVATFYETLGPAVNEYIANNDVFQSSFVTTVGFRF